MSAVILTPDFGPDARRASNHPFPRPTAHGVGDVPATPKAVIVRWDRRLGRVVDLRILGGRAAVVGLRLAEIAGWAFVAGLTAFVFFVGLAEMIWPGMGGF